MTTEEGSVQGVAYLRDKFYVVCDDSGSIFVYDVAPHYTRLDDIPLPCGGDDDQLSPCDLAACATTLGLYVTDCNRDCIWYISVIDRVTVTRWKNGIGDPYRLSVTADGMVIVPGEGQLNIFRPDGILELTVPLSNEVADPQHSVRTSAGTFIIATGDGKIVEVSAEGCIIRLCRGDVETPQHLAIDAVHGSIFVIDRRIGNERILLLDRQLKLRRVLLSRSDKDRVEGCCRIAFSDGLLLVGMDFEEENELQGGCMDVYSLATEKI